MKKCIALVIISVCIGSAYGVRPSFGLQAGWAYLKPENIDGHHFFGPGITTTAPFSRYIGLSASVFWLKFDLTEEATVLGMSGRFGLIEMVPTKYVSPYFEQSILLDHISADGYSSTDFGFGVGLGLEFISSGYVSPYIGGEFTYLNSSYDGISTHAIGIGAGIGVRFSWVK